MSKEEVCLDPSAKRYLTLLEAANYLNCHVFALRTAIWKGQLRAAKVGHRFVIERGDLDAFFDQLKAGA